MGDCSKYSDATNRCPDVIGSGCVRYTGPDIPCLDICSGASLSVLEKAIADKLCEIAGDVDMSTIVIPACLVTAWGIKDKDILTLIQFILDQYCVMQGEIDSLETQLSNFNPVVTLEWSCCADDPCVKVGTITIQEAFTNIISCLCNLKTYVGEVTLPNGISTISELVTLQSSQIETLQGQVASLLLQQAALMTSINNMKTSLNGWTQVVNSLPATIALPHL